MKNRDRSEYTFANINFLGKCNLDCDFCLGKDLAWEFSRHDTMSQHWSAFPNLDAFLDHASDAGIEQLYLTGQNTDPLLYEHLAGFMDHLQSRGFFVGMRTNGILALRQIENINSCTSCRADAVGYTILTSDDEAFKAMTGRAEIPEWDNICAQTRVPYRISIVVTPHNLEELSSIVQWCSHFEPRPRYIQIRRVSTEFRHATMKPHQDCYDSALRRHGGLDKGETFETARVTQWHGLPVTWWNTVATTANSMNYYTNGVMSDDYFIIEGYLNAMAAKGPEGE